MVTKNERHKKGMRRQNQSKAVLNRTGSEMEEFVAKEHCKQCTVSRCSYTNQQVRYPFGY